MIRSCIAAAVSEGCSLMTPVKCSQVQITKLPKGFQKVQGSFHKKHTVARNAGLPAFFSYVDEKDLK
jgi:hypothetical protein